MKRPHVSLENAEAVYEYFSDKQINKPFMRALHWACARVYKPHVIYDEGTEEAITQHFKEGKQASPLLIC